MQHRVSFGAVPEEKPFEQDGLNDSAHDKRDMDEDTSCKLASGVGGWEDEFGKDDPKGDGEDQECALNDEEEDGRGPDAVLA